MAVPVPVAAAAAAVVCVVLLSASVAGTEGCRLGSLAEPSRFERVPENLQSGTHVLVFEAEQTSALRLQPVNKDEDYTDYFRPVLITNDTAGVVVSQPLTSLVQREQPVSVVKFRVFCESDTPFTGSDSLLVTLYIEDVNDHPPVFVDGPYQVTVDELTPSGMVIFDEIVTKDRDKANTANSDIYYWISRGNENLKFSLTPLPNNGVSVVLEKPLDFESGDRELNLTITASDRGAPARLSRTQLTVSVRDGDDQPPVFTAPIYRASVTEYPGSQMRSLQLLLRTEPAILAYDGDLAINQPLSYGIKSGNTGEHFSIDGSTGALTLIKTFDREQMEDDEVTLTIEAWQTDDRSRSAQAAVKVKVTDLNDNRPDFMVDRYNISIIENLLHGFSIVQVHATDADKGENANFTYSLDDPSGAFDLDPATGWLTVADQTKLDRETQLLLKLDIYADELMPNVLDKRRQSRSVTNVMINLLDSNDNNPQFLPTNTYQFIVEGNSSVDTVIGEVRATDPDEGANGRVRFSFENNTLTGGEAAFSVSSETGELRQSRALPAGSYVLFVRAEDSPESAGQTRSALAVVTVLVRPRNVRPPRVPAGQRLWVGKDVLRGSRVGQLIADDPDGDDLTFRLRNVTELFEVEENTGVIRAFSAMSETDQTKYSLGIDVTDGTHLTTSVVDIFIVPDNAEESFESASYSFYVEENLSNVTIGVLLNRTDATDDILEAKILNTSLNETFQVTPKGELRLLKSLDFEAGRELSFTVVLQYTRRGQRHVRAAGVTVHVLDTNDNPPRFSSRRYSGTVPAGAIRSTLLTLTPEVRVSDPDEVRSRLEFRLRGCGEVFHVSALALVSVGEEGFERETYECELEVVDEDGRGDNSSLEVRVLGWGSPREKEEGQRSPSEKTSALTDRSTVGVTKDSNPDNSREPSSHTSTGQHTTEQDPLQLDNIVERQDFRSRALSESSQVLTQLLGSATELNASSVVRATVRIPAGLPVGSAIYQLPASILPKLEKQDRGGLDGLVEMWPKYDIAKGETRKSITRAYSSGEQHFAVRLSADGGVVLLARSLSAPGQMVLRVLTREEGEPRDVLAMLVDIVTIPRPQLRQDEVTVTLDEGEYTDKQVGVLQLAKPPQDRENVVFSIADDNPSYRVSQDGTVFISGELDFEHQRQLSVGVLVCPQLCTDLASALPLRGSVRDACRHTCAAGIVTIKLRDLNDSPPQFRLVSEIVTTKRGLQNEPNPPYAVYKLHTPEVLEKDTVIVNMSTFDADGKGANNGQVRFQLITPDEDFSLDAETGRLTTTQEISFAPGATRRLIVAAYDLGEPSLRSMALLELTATGVDSIEPARAFDRRVYTIVVPENSVVARLPVPWKVTSSAPPAPHRWSVRQLDSSVVGFSAHVNEKILELSGAIDFEKQRQIWLVVTLESESESNSGQISVSESEPKSTPESLSESRLETASRLVSPRAAPFPLSISPPSLDTLHYNQALLQVDVTDVNDNGPRFNVSRLTGIAGVPYDAGYGFNVMQLQATDKDQGDNITYYLNSTDGAVQSTFSVGPSSGQVRLLRRADSSIQRLHRLQLIAVDAANHTDAADVLVYVLDSRDMLVAKLNRTATHVGQHKNGIARGLSELAAADVRILRVSPHSDGELVDDKHSDVWLYALEPTTSTLLSSQQLMARLDSSVAEISGGPQLGVHVAGMWPATEPARGFFTNLKFIIIGLSLIIFLLMAITLGILCCKSCQRDHKTSPYPPLTLTPAASGYSATPPPTLASDVTTMTSQRQHQQREMVERRGGHPRDAGGMALVLEVPLYSKPSRLLPATQISPGHYVADAKQLSQTLSRRRHDPAQGQTDSHVRYGSLNYPHGSRAANQLAAILTPERPLAGANVRRQSVTNSLGDGTEVGVATMSFYSESPSDMPPADYGRGLRPDGMAPSPPRAGDEQRYADSPTPHGAPSTGHLRTHSSDVRGEDYLDSLEPGQFSRTWSVKQ